MAWVMEYFVLCELKIGINLLLLRAGWVVVLQQNKKVNLIINEFYVDIQCII